MLVGCTSESSEPNTVQDFPIIPQPQSIAPGLGEFMLSPEIILRSDLTSDSARFVSDYLQTYLLENLGFSLARDGKGSALRLELAENFEPSYYELLITQKGALIKAGDETGLFYGAQSFLQLADHYQLDGEESSAIPCGYIKDQPEFVYRGMHLDVARHMFPVDFIKQYIDLLAHYKMNRFHWHLTEDQGWRIEIKQYPKLQEVAAYRPQTLIGHNSDQPQRFDGERYGGFYTQEEVEEIVQYAKERFVTVIPEIEMPGHSTAAIAAYPELSCHGRQIQSATKWGVFEDIYCPTEATFTFLENVLTEVMELFPSEYIHIGGDEAPKKQWEESAFCQRLMQEEGLADENELQAYFIRRIETFLNEHGRQLIGWDEILEGGLAPNATVMSWRGEQGGIEAAKAGHNVIMTPTSHCYLDYYQSRHPDEPLAIGGYLPLEKVFNYYPVPAELDQEEAKHILGVQGNLWTEYVSTPQKAEYMAYPRMMALAEVGWTGNPKNKDFKNFVARLRPQIDRLRARGINVATTIYDAQPSVTTNAEAPLRLRWSNQAAAGTIRYTNNGNTPTRNSEIYEAPLPVRSGTYCAQTFLPEGPIGHSTCVTIDLHKGANKPIVLNTKPHPSYPAGGPQSLLNGVQGQDDSYSTGEWMGFQGEAFSAVIDLKELDTLQEIAMRFFHSPGSWVHAPTKVEIAFAKIENEWSDSLSTSIPVPSANGALPISRSMVPTEARFVRVRIFPMDRIPPGLPGAGEPPFFFIDEIKLR